MKGFVYISWLFVLSACTRGNTQRDQMVAQSGLPEDTTIADMRSSAELGSDTLLTAANTRIGDDLKEVNSTFTFKGEGINPKIIERFQPWLSDGLPLNITIDIAAAWHTDEYYREDDTTTSSVLCNTEMHGEGNEARASYFCYSYVGKLENGIHVVETSESGGGSGVFKGLLFFKFSQGEGRYSDGRKYSQLLMTLVASETLGDRSTAQYEFEKNKLIIKIKPRPTCDECRPQRKEIIF